MAGKQKTVTARSIVEDVFGTNDARELWTGDYDKVLPVTIQDFELFAVLPAIFYMFRFGWRRGKGRFVETFAPKGEESEGKKQKVTIARIAETLAQDTDFLGFDGPIGRAVLGDLLLCFCLENAKHALGREEQVQRAAPAHYMASWIDLPGRVAHLRFVPEMIVAMLADQTGDHVQKSREGERTWFPVGPGFEQNVLLGAFNHGMTRRDISGDMASDLFLEDAQVGVDQLLMIRLAQKLGVAPDKLWGGEGMNISNQRPIAKRAARNFSEDIRRFVRDYSAIIPRHAFVDLLQSCMAVGLTTIATGVVEILFEWAEAGKIPDKEEQGPGSLFVDCSNGVDRRLRGLAEQSFANFNRRLERIPVILMALRLLDAAARYDPKIKQTVPSVAPYATEWINVLGDIFMERHGQASYILHDLGVKSERLAETLKDEYPDTVEILRSGDRTNPVWPLAEALTHLQGRGNTQANLIKFFDSALLLNRPNGLAQKRAVIRTTPSPRGIRKRMEMRSMVLTDSVLDYLVHLHVLPAGNRHGNRRLSLNEFIGILEERYGLCIDMPSDGMTISNDQMQANRAFLERRLRDLGLLVGVNDAESMKRLRPRYLPIPTENHHGVD